MRKERITWIIILLCLITLGLMMLPRTAGASDGLPTGVTVFEAGDHTCVLYSVNGGDKAVMECFCPCDCSVSPNEPVKTEKPEPTKEPTPIPPTPTVEPTEKPKCNSGRGNGSEGDPDCDPGKSYKNQGGD